MGKLLVITVPPSVGSTQYEVILGDCVLPGFVLGSFEAAKDADDACRRFAAHYSLKGYPYDTPWKRRSDFVLLQGGRETTSASTPTKREP